jgi:hypothetical protein
VFWRLGAGAKTIHQQKKRENKILHKHLLSNEFNGSKSKSETNETY